MISSNKTTVIGAGLAGLTVGYLAKDHGINIPIIEAKSDVGGLIHTAKLPRLGRIDLGAEYIDAEHLRIRALCEKLNVPLHRVYPDDSTGPNVEFIINNIRYNGMQFQEHSRVIVEKIKEDKKKVLEDPSYLIQFKHLSVKQYLESIDTPLWVTKAFIMMHETEFGAASSELSAREFLTMGYDRISSRCPSIYGPGYGQYVVKGGTSRIIEALYEKVSDNIFLNNPLEAIVTLSDGRYELTFRNNVVHTDTIVLAIPLPSLKSIDFSNSGLNDLSKTAIRRINYGRSVKMFFGFVPGATPNIPPGETYVDLLGGTVWITPLDESASKPQTVVLLRGGPACDLEQDPEVLVNYLKASFPSSNTQWIGAYASFEYDERDQYQGGSWIAVSPDQENLLTSLRTPQKGIAFAGAHIGEEAGYMDGAVESALNLSNFLF